MSQLTSLAYHWQYAIFHFYHIEHSFFALWRLWDCMKRGFILMAVHCTCVRKQLKRLLKPCTESTALWMNFLDKWREHDHLPSHPLEESWWDNVSIGGAVVTSISGSLNYIDQWNLNHIAPKVDSLQRNADNVEPERIGV